MDIRNNLIFGGVSAKDYGIYISGEGVYNAPVRDVELVTVPGRNGVLTIDHGRYENIEIEYPAFCFATSQAEFRRKIATYRNAVLSQVGYQRIEDTYHPEEYRLGVYSNGLETEPVMYGRATEFTLKFNCKPQRFLLLGEENVSIENGATLYNPTQHEAYPLLGVYGYGSIGFNGYNIELEDGNLGDIILAEPTDAGTFSFSNVQYNNGDVITLDGGIQLTQYYTDSDGINNLTYTVNTNFNGAEVNVTKVSSTRFLLTITIPTYTQTAATYINYYCTAYISYTRTGQSTVMSPYMSVNSSYWRAGTTDNMYIGWSGAGGGWEGSPGYKFTPPTKISVYSSIWRLGDPTYIDCDLGEAYMIKDGVPVSLNQYIDLGSDLPKLASGNNVFEVDDTITGLEIVPRWWQI